MFLFSRNQSSLVASRRHKVQYATPGVRIFLKNREIFSPPTTFSVHSHLQLFFYIPVSSNFRLPRLIMFDWTAIFAWDIPHCIATSAKASSLPLLWKPNEKCGCKQAYRFRFYMTDSPPPPTPQKGWLKIKYAETQYSNFHERKTIIKLRWSNWMLLSWLCVCVCMCVCTCTCVCAVKLTNTFNDNSF